VAERVDISTVQRCCVELLTSDDHSDAITNDCSAVMLSHMQFDTQQVSSDEPFQKNSCTDIWKLQLRKSPKP